MPKKVQDKAHYGIIPEKVIHKDSASLTYNKLKFTIIKARNKTVNTPIFSNQISNSNV